MILKNDNGEDLILYRGERGNPDVNEVRTKLPCIYFGEVRTANVYALEGHFTEVPRLFPVKLEMKRPFINQPTDPFLSVGVLVFLLGWSRAHNIALKYAELIEQTSHWEELQTKDPSLDSVKVYLDKWPAYFLGDLYFQAYPFFKDLENIQLLVKLGFDGAIHAGSGHGSAGTPEYCVFNKDQVHYLFEGK